MKAAWELLPPFLFFLLITSVPFQLAGGLACWWLRTSSGWRAQVAALFLPALSSGVVFFCLFWLEKWRANAHPSMIFLVDGIMALWMFASAIAAPLLNLLISATLYLLVYRTWWPPQLP